MSKKPAGDLGNLIVSKATAAEAVPFAISTPSPTRGTVLPVSVSKSLTVKLDAATYTRLRTYCFAREQASGARMTHQDIMVTALLALLEREGA